MTAKGPRLRVDPIACDGRGLCAELLPELIQLDEWGYPVVADVPIRSSLDRDARRAVAMCPTLALRLEPFVRSARPAASASPAP